ncbi:hypothetical protein BJ138DRAFT_1127188 [Hygrophoropsis aurantiaca]|uniref:Uncharacterized protein n=1 Tax=Hygrophoropsis aurantiaca TaxID=72124 RepID=A0ACB8A9K0_9AGAM|nr:hypothetical protein BJ138DRAFT_1127188 [Hygrophoropsis aurantiaca]
MSDGTRLRQAWYDALSGAETNFRQLLTSYSSSEWKHVSLSGETYSPGKGKSRATATPELTDVVVHRKTAKSGENVYRVVLDVPTIDDSVSLDSWKAVLTTPELRQEWDPAVEAAQLVEMFDHRTRISKTNFTLGWPANPRDAVTISRLYQDSTTIIDISTSLPRSADEPAYLRPSPPYVRSNVPLFTWCVQLVQPSPPAQSAQPAEQLKKKITTIPRLRITCFWQHDLRAIWNFGSSSSLCQQLCTMMVGLFKTVKQRGTRVPMLAGYGLGVSIERIRFQLDRQALTIDYGIHPEEEDHTHSSENNQGLDELNVLREHRRLTRSIECVLPSCEGWDVQVSTKASSEQVEKLPWTANAFRKSPGSPTSPSSKPIDLTVFRISHSSLPDDHSILKVKVVLELSGPSGGIRLNGLPQTIQSIEERDPSAFFVSQQILQDASSAADVSFQTSSSVSSVNTIGSSNSRATPTRPQLARTLTERSLAADKSILSRVKRSYIYFSSLLQEPEAKWRRTTETRGVSVTQLDSIDPTLVVYRAEATFVGLGLWDLYGALASPGARVFWDKQHEDATLLEDVNELTELWHFKTKPAWPVVGRDTVLLKTVYKSPTTIHVFSFSADDPYLFPNIPPLDPNVIRTQVDLQGWAIEALSPSTTQLTLLEQSDPKGWSNKASIPQQMINAVAGVGEFTIKCGGPPVVTRLAGAKANEIRYDHERGMFRIEYEGSEPRRAPAPSGSDDTVKEPRASNSMSTIECEIRCDIDAWASALDIVIDPPPQNISALRRHRLSAGGGGLWLTITHDALFANDERLLAIVRRGPMGSGKDRGTVMVNGARVNVDVEELPEQEIKALTKKKRIKPARIPLDQPPVVGVMRRRRAEWDADGNSDSAPSSTSVTPEPPEPPKSPAPATAWLSAPKFSSPLASFFSTAVEQATATTQQAVSAISPVGMTGDGAVPSSSKVPMQHAMDALHWLRGIQSTPSSDGWVPLADKGLTIQRKIFPDISLAIPVHKGEKVVEGVSAEEVASVVTSYECRKQWDDRFDSATMLESFGARCHTAFVVSKGGFPFRDRGFYLSSVMARARLPSANADATPGETGQSSDSRNVIFCVSASFSPDSVASFSPGKYNPYALPIGRVFVDGWMLETLDPYTKENYAIPSTRCTRIVAVDFAGSIPAAVNSMINSALPRSIVAVESYMKNMSSLPLTRLPGAGVILAEGKEKEAPSSTESGAAPSWKLRRRDDNRVLVSSAFDPAERSYETCIFLTMPIPTPGPPKLEETTPKPSKISLNTLSSTPDVRSTNRAELSQSPSTPLSTPKRRRTSSASLGSGSGERVKSSSSAFTVKGEIKHSTDLLVAEVIIDSKLYPAGYDIQTTSRPRENMKYISLQVSKPKSDDVLPIGYALYTVPASPLHSAGLNADRPPRHLLRLTLPTAQYQVSTVQDPLTGEIRSAPPKPQWFLDLQERGFVVEVGIRPSGPGLKRGGGTVKVNGASVTVATEKESLTSLGRDELLDDRVAKVAVLQRSLDGEELFPEDLKTPLALADHVLDDGAAILASNNSEDVKIAEEGGAKLEDSDAGPTQDSPNNGPTTQPSAPLVSSGGLLGFLNSYPNPLSRWTQSPPRNPSSRVTSAAPSRRSSGNLPKLPGGIADPGVRNPGPISLPAALVPRTRAYPLSMVLIIALIAFLIGSLLRSLLSPADFIYVVTDLRDAEEVTAGWREIRRLVEVKYIVGGWDFQIAVVRRH